MFSSPSMDNQQANTHTHTQNQNKENPGENLYTSI